MARISLSPPPASSGLIERIELDADSTTLDFTDIPQDWTHLVFEVMWRTDRAGSAADNAKVAFNDDTTVANYTRQAVEGALGVTTSGSAGDARVAVTTAATASATDFAVGRLVVPFYRKGQNKIINALTGRAGVQLYTVSCRWSSSAAISRVTFRPVNGTNFVAGTVVELWGTNSAPF